MAFVYRYMIPDDGATVYVGKTGGDDLRALAARISSHHYEKKFIDARPPGGYVVEYIDHLTKADADIIETALIGAWNPVLNSSKKGWACSEYIAPAAFRWKRWDQAELFARGKFDAPDKPYLYCCDRCGKKVPWLPKQAPPSLSYDLSGGPMETCALRFYCLECYDIIWRSMERITEEATE